MSWKNNVVSVPYNLQDEAQNKILKSTKPLHVLNLTKRLVVFAVE